MADADDVRRLAVGLAGVVEIDSAGFDFRVAGKGRHPTANRLARNPHRAGPAEGTHRRSNDYRRVGTGSS